MKKMLFVLAAICGLAFFAPEAAQAGGPHVSVSFGVPVPVVVYPSRGYYCDPAAVYYYDRAPRRYYRRPVRAVYRDEPRRHYRTGYRSYYRGRRYCD